MTTDPSSHRYGAPLALLVLGLLAFSLYLHARLVPYADDDAYIHMRIARNLWDSGLPYFNKGEAVMASTSPLWVILTAPTAMLRSLQPLAIAMLNAAIVVAAAWAWALLYGHLTRRCQNRSEVSLAMILVFFTLAPASVGLMETPLALFLVGVGLRAMMKDSSMGLPLLSASAFVRPECAMFAVAGVVWKLVRQRASSGLELLASATLVGSLAAFQLYFYGSVYPHTAHAKAIVYTLSNVDFLWQLFVGSYGAWIATVVLPPVGLSAIVMIAVAVLRRRNSVTSSYPRQMDFSALLVIIAPAVVILVVYAAKAVLIFPWYAPLYLVPFHLALLRVALMLEGAARLAAMVLLAPCTVLACCIVVGSHRFEFLPFYSSGARARNLQHVGEWLARQHPNATVMAPEIGALGFTFEGHIEDAVGLASPNSLRFHPMKVPEQRLAGFLGSVPAQLIEESKPMIVVGLDVFMTDFMKSGISAQYEILKLPPLRDEDHARIGSEKVFGADALILAIRK